MKRRFTAAAVMMVAASLTAQVTETELRDAHGAHAGKTVHVGSLALTVRSDADGHFGAGNMPTLASIKDQNGRDTELRADNGDLIARLAYDGEGHPAKIAFGDGMQLTVTRDKKRSYKETLVGPTGKVIRVRDVDATYSRPNGGLVLDAVASTLGLSANWRNEVTIEASASTYIVKSNATGKPLLYVVRDGPNEVGFDTNGQPLFYEVWANLYSGFATHPDEFGDLQTVVPDRFIYTRDGRVGAYVYTPSRTAISSVWVEKNAAGVSVIKYQCDVEPPAPNSGSSPGNANATNESAAARNPRRSLRPGVETSTCYSVYEYTYQTCEYYPDGTLIGCSDPTAVYDRYCVYTPDPLGGGATGGGSPLGEPDHWHTQQHRRKRDEQSQYEITDLAMQRLIRKSDDEQSSDRRDDVVYHHAAARVGDPAVLFEQRSRLLQRAIAANHRRPNSLPAELVAACVDESRQHSGLGV